MSAWEQNVRKVVPYVPGEQPKIDNVIKLNTNENPYGPAPGVAEAIRNLDAGRFRLYPDPAASVLVDAIAENYGLDPDQVFVGVGSDDVLAMSFLTFFNSGKPVFFPDITYSFYDVWADMLRIPYEQKPLKADFTIEKKDYMQPNGGIVFPNPNAPTGVEESLAMIEEIAAANPSSVVIIDEAYVDFGAHSALSLTEKYDNLLIVQTMSKSRSMAGMRIGYAMGNPQLIRYLNDVKFSFNSYTMDAASLAAGVAAIRDTDYFRKTTGKIIQTREWTKKELKRLGFSFADSKSNFIFASHASCSARTLFEELKKNRIFVRYFEKPRIDNYLRITIGTDEQMKIFIDFLEKFL